MSAYKARVLEILASVLRGHGSVGGAGRGRKPAVRRRFAAELSGALGVVAPAGGRGIRLAGPSAPRSVPPWSARLGHEPSAVRGAVDPERRMNHGGRRSQPRRGGSDRPRLGAPRRAPARGLTPPGGPRARRGAVVCGGGRSP